MPTDRPLEYSVLEEDPMNEEDIDEYNRHVRSRQSLHNLRGLYFGSHCESPQSVLLPLIPNDYTNEPVTLTAVDSTVLVPVTWEVPDDCRVSFSVRGIGNIIVYYSDGVSS